MSKLGKQTLNDLIIHLFKYGSEMVEFDTLKDQLGKYEEQAKEKKKKQLLKQKDAIEAKLKEFE